MNIENCLILHALAPCKPDVHDWVSPAAHVSFTGLELLEPETLPKPDILYVAAPAFLLQHRAFLQKDCFIVCCGKLEDLTGQPHHAYLLFLEKPSTIQGIFNNLNRLFCRLRDWDSKLNETLLSGADAQHFLDISEDLFTNPVVLLTDTLHIAGIIPKSGSAHPDIQFMEENKFLPPQMVQQLTSKAYLQKAESFYTIGFYYPPNYMDCTIVIRKFCQNPWHLNILCTYGIYTEPTDVDLVLLRHVSKYIIAAANRQQELNAQFSNRSGSFLYDLLSGTAPKGKELEATASYLHLPLTGTYQLYVISFRTPLESHSRYVLLNLDQMIPSVLKLIYHESILILDNLGDGADASHEKVIMEALHVQLPINNAYCGISQPFQDLRLLKDVFLLTRRTAKLEMKIHPDRLYYAVRDTFATSLLATAAEQIDITLLYLRELDRLRTYDEQHHSNNMELLRVLLEHERNITSVSKVMHLHRNSVLYRVNRIQQILHVSLDDADVRLNLLLSFKALQLMHEEA